MNAKSPEKRECIAPGLIIKDHEWCNLYPDEWEYWQTHVLPFGWFIVLEPSFADKEEICT